MNEAEYEQLKQHRKSIKGSDLKDKTPRTLIYGYNMERESVHVYLNSDGVICMAYGDERNVRHFTEEETENNRDYIPSKRAYVECTDLEFAKLLKEAGECISFTTPNRDRPQKQFYGITK